MSPEQPAQLDIQFWKLIVEIVKVSVTAIVATIGGVWTYRAFIRQRLAFQKANLELDLADFALPGGHKLVRVSVTVVNTGSTILRSDYAELRLRQVVPVPKAISDAVACGVDPVPADRTQVEWPLLAQREWQWDSGDFEIEPGEKDAVHADFAIDDHVEVVEFYFFIHNAQKKHTRIGWTLTQHHSFSEEV